MNYNLFFFLQYFLLSHQKTANLYNLIFSKPMQNNMLEMFVEIKPKQAVTVLLIFTYGVRS